MTAQNEFANVGRWWTKSDDDIASALCGYARYVQQTPAQLSRIERLRRNARLYANAEIVGLRPWEFGRVPMTLPSAPRVTMNVIASCVQTAAAKLGTNRPAPQFLTNGADWELRRKTEKINKFGKGVLYQSGAYQKGVQCFIDACVFDLGVMKVYGDDERGTIVAERVMPWDVLVEEADGYYGAPRTLVQRSYIDRQVLIETWGDGDELRIGKIRLAKGVDTASGGTSDQIEVYEGWHLPSGPKAKDGKHVIAIDGCYFVCETWDRERFPFAFFRWEDSIAGFYGRGMADRLVGLQFEINILLRKITETMRLMGRSFIVLDAASGIPKSHMDNATGAVYVSAPGGRAPQIIAPQSVNPELIAQVNLLYQRAFQEVGMSELSAQSQKPAGLDSKVALQEFNDIESERFLDRGKAWEQFYMDVVHAGLDEAREMKNLAIDVPDRNSKTTIKWADVKLDRDAYVLQCFPISVLPSTPAGRLQKITDMMSDGLIDRANALEKLEIPDMDEMVERELAASNAIRSRIASMLDDGEYAEPESFDDLTLAVKFTNAVYLIERTRGCPEPRLDLLRRFISSAIALIPKPPAAAPAGAQPMPAGDPTQTMAAPMAA